jgi:integrase
VEAWLAARVDAGSGRSTVRRSRSTLARVLRWGQRRDLVARNAAELAEMPPTAAPDEGRALTGPELARLLREAEGTRLAAVWWVMAGLGLRPGEALGLCWPDVDLEGAVLHVRRARKLRNGRPELSDLKTARSRRSLAMPPAVVDALTDHRRRWAEERLTLGHTWPTEWEGLVFPTEAGTPVDPSNLSRDLDRLTRAGDLGHVRPYDLRHTCATLMASAGTPLERVADVLGHNGIGMARMVYTHATAPTVTAAVGPMGDALALPVPTVAAEA